MHQSPFNGAISFNNNITCWETSVPYAKDILEKVLKDSNMDCIIVDDVDEEEIATILTKTFSKYYSATSDATEDPVSTTLRKE